MTPVWKNEDLEGAVIGAIFLRGADPEVLDILSRVPATAFSVPQYREIYTGICRQARGAGVIDPVLLCENMPKHSAIIMDSSRIAWAKSALVSYVATLERNAAVRDAEAVIERALADLRSAHNGDAALSAFRAAQNSIAAISLEEKTIQPVHIDDILPAVVDRVDARNRGLEEARSLMTGIEELDAKTGGIEPTDLVFIAARPSMGKTEFALDIIDKVSEQGRGVLFFSMEMPNIQIGERMVSAAGGMSVSRLKKAADFEDEDWARLTNGVERLTGRSIWMVDSTDLTVDQIQQIATRLQLAHPEIALVVVDYLALIKIESTARHDLAVGEVSKGLKRLAKSNKTPVLALSQLSRGVESRPNKRPMNSDLKNSGEIEADADLIMMLYRDEVYNPESPAKGIAEINVTKQRNGELGTIYRRFYNGHFLPIDQELAKQRSAPQQKTQTRRYAKDRQSSNADY
ncbi:replicative DNA helicase [Enterobacter roggenkampii]|uniref:replicative DNA helicase n=1 Tax=Enterobacter roggenkampii TaxID=1812935 RepID=UPI002005A316|nr:replicative DNA helicase [Enterobacter roggenkampii]MCK6921871.1 replicative DNA helicase [Enterobacter roggenkampii]